MNYQQLYEQIKAKKSFLCVGLDSDPKLLPECLKGVQYPIYEFNKAIIDKTAQYAVAYKPNLAFYEAEGVAGWIQLEMTLKYLRDKYGHYLSGAHPAPTIEYDDEAHLVKVSNIHWGRKK